MTVLLLAQERGHGWMCARAVNPTHDRPVSTCSVHAAGRIFWGIAPSDQFGVEARNELQPPHIVAHARKMPRVQPFHVGTVSLALQLGAPAGIRDKPAS